jgi:hypothetical protein
MPRAGAHALLTRPPLKPPPKERSPFDLHVLGAPPAFVLSQDQTLSFILFPNQHGPSSGDRCPMQNTAAKLSPPSLRALRHHIGHPQGSRPTGLKGNDELLPEPPTTPRLTATSASGMSGKKPRVTSDAPRTSDPPSGRRPRIPSCLSIHHVKQQTPRNQAVAIRPRRSVSGTRYIDSSPARLKALFAEI